MKLHFDEITGKTDRYFIADSHWFPSTEECSVVASTATIAVSRQDRDTVVLKGKIEGRCKVVCDRCGEPFEENLQSEFIYLATTREEASFALAEQECSDEDALVLHLAEPIIEIDDILREQVLLAVPFKNLCNEDCKGICAGCGVILNKESCQCKPDQGGSPFAVLKKLKKQES